MPASHRLWRAFGLQLSIAKHLAGDLLDFAYDPLFRSFDPIFVHDLFSRKVKPPWAGDVHSIAFDGFDRYRQST
jgi:hypothetical protein